MRDDLQGLDISHDQLKNATNLPVNNKLIIITNIIQQFIRKSLKKAQQTEKPTVIFAGLTIFVCTYLFLVKIPFWISIIFVLWVCGTTQTLLYLLWKGKNKFLNRNMTNSLRILLNDVERYNSVIKAIDINDQIEDVGNLGVGIQEREKVLEALELTRNDLIRALKTERILRENKHFIITNSNLFTNNLATLASMQVSEEATEHGRILNEALQISLDVQEEMKRLQSKNEH
ncbi:hypothetical protein RI030_11030 [Aphanizomenon flos-aquae NRERC-008]|uniref:Uncharacterized protein n=2 Tax=Aphanizomenon flos-aquae TaxID=1176 RepID=A0A1B7X6G8_APHFL|nr:MULTISPECIES: hypothetical protein [Aphanizomenon]MBD1216744.1 hypothetical protein [Aphanizomenon flos-aquae Clear-A1]MBD2389424.1 hypothetical protein [Aphanizomenon flos-aquae FACHB-1171]MBD2555898.1 hypothetical protein [Aphanizomenon flos-aquae FACHB-1290]MBD2631981.1 hypothetical protein [Aphanizomenon sp. FACHB-1399]MBD2656485.1 hypothetical protein [Aphanizomenon flos-aquae FACHB-1265]MBD2672662.1 hypothetical protein [Aphanizomenon flos-aquae FACHB-1416]MBD2684364.1 hypothetical 